MTSSLSERPVDGDDELDRALEDLTEAIYQVNVANGWYDDSRSFGDGIALLHTEVSEMFEAFRSWETTDMTAEMCKQSAGHGEEHLCKPEGVGSEAADILIRLLDECRRQSVDLGFEVRRKLTFNATRGYRHGGKHI